MTDYTRDTPAVGRTYCPGCEPDTDRMAEVLDTRWCDAHSNTPTGQDDGLVTTGAYPSGSSEAGGDDNRRWCNFFHREIRRTC